MTNDPSINRLKIGNLTVEIRQGRNTKLLIFRNDRPDASHLLISFGNPSKEIDIHLKRRTAGGQEEHRCVTKVAESDVALVFGKFEPRFREAVVHHVSNLRPVRPGWLARKGYLISYLDAEAEGQMIELFAPKRKYHSKLERVLKAAGLKDYLNSDLPGETIFLPAVLHELKKLKYDRPIMVGRIRGKHKPRLGAVCLLETADGNLKWFPIHKLTHYLMPLGKMLIDQLRSLVSEAEWKLVWEELHLDEVDWIAGGN